MYDVTCLATKYRNTEMFLTDIFCEGTGDIFLEIRQIIVPSPYVLDDKTNFKLWLHNLWKQKDLLIKNFDKAGYNKLDSPYETDLVFHVVLVLMIVFIVKNLGYKYLLANLVLTYTKLLLLKLFC